VKQESGVIYVVATPIGHLSDITLRAIDILKTVDKIVVEDTRHSQRLLKHLNIKKPLVAMHNHNEREKAHAILAEVQSGITLAMISDAGTPLINDPGYHLVHLAHELGVQVIPIPGPCSLIAALSASGLATNRFIFEGFLPVKKAARRQLLAERLNESGTLIYFEAPHRIVETLEILLEIFGESRVVVIARELTKTFETIQKDTLGKLVVWLKNDPNQQKGEFVLLIEGVVLKSKTEITEEAERIVKTLLSHLSVKETAKIAAELTGLQKHVLYEYALQLSST
jgi:16S rRNA (cytidine1402-2'-O)-methyltransferase